MRFVYPELERGVMLAARTFPAVVLTGPRRGGTTWLLWHSLPNPDYS